MTKRKAIPTTYKGIRFASKNEAMFAKQLDDKNISWLYEAEAIDYVLPAAKYKPDFKLVDTEDLYVEVKGFFPHKDRQKMLAVKEQYPNKNFILAFLKPDTKISRGPRGKTYRQWAEDHGFKLWEQYEDQRDQT